MNRIERALELARQQYDNAVAQRADGCITEAELAEVRQHRDDVEAAARKIRGKQ